MPLRPDALEVPEVTSSGSGSEPDGIAVPVIWENVPQRNMSFTGREDLLAELRQHVSARPVALVPHALYGLGGVGKTQLAARVCLQIRRPVSGRLLDSSR